MTTRMRVVMIRPDRAEVRTFAGPKAEPMTGYHCRSSSQMHISTAFDVHEFNNHPYRDGDVVEAGLFQIVNDLRGCVCEVGDGKGCFVRGRYADTGGFDDKRVGALSSVELARILADTDDDTDSPHTQQWMVTDQ